MQAQLKNRKKSVRDFLCFLASLIFTLFFSAFASAQEHSLNYSIYVVQPGDTLSGILHRNHLEPLYGKNGSIQKIVQLNLETVQRNGDLIYPGATLRLPGKFQDSLAVSPQEKPVSQVSRDDRKIASVAEPEPTPVPAPTPVAEKKAEVCEPPPALPAASVKDEKPLASSEIYTGLRIGYSGLFGQDSSNGTTGKLLSKLNFGADLDWKQNWSDVWSSHLFLRFEQTQLEPDQTGAALLDASNGLSAFGLGVSANLSPRWTIGADAEFAETLFYEGYSGAGGGLEMNVLPILRLHPEVSYLALEQKPLSLFLGGGISYYGPSSYDNYNVESGYGYNVDVALRHSFQSSYLQCKFFYEERRQNTTLLDLDEKDLGANCGFAWRFQ